MAATRFAAQFNANEYAYGVGPTPPAALLVDIGTTVGGAGTLTLAKGQITLADGTSVSPLNINAPITVGIGANAETVTPTAVSGGSLQGYDQTSVTATFTNAHGTGDPISSGTFGLQEAINAAAGFGGGTVIIDARWALFGGTNAMIAAAVLPSGVTIQDNRGGGGTGALPSGKNTGAAVTAPVAATSATVASQAGIVGTWTATTIHVQFTYVTANGGETLASADYSFTSTASVAIGGKGPAAATGVVGYRVYIGTTAWLAPVTAANGTVIQAGPIAAFAIGTPFSIATATVTGVALVPGVSSAWITSAGVGNNDVLTFPPFANVGAISAATATPLADVNLPAGFLNFVGRTLRIRGTATITTNSATGTLTINLLLYSVYGVTSITPFTAVSTSVAFASAVVNCEFDVLMNTTAVGATGTLECHGVMALSQAGTAVATMSMDFIHAASSTVDLTKQNTLEVSITTATVAPTAGNVRQLVIEVLQ